MARTNIAIQNVDANEQLTPTFSAMDDVNDHDFVNTGRELVIVQNDDGSPHTVTIVSKGDPVYGRTGDLVKAVAAGAREIFGFLNPSGWNQAAGSLVHVDIDDDTSMTVAVCQIKG